MSPFLDSQGPPVRIAPSQEELEHLKHVVECIQCDYPVTRKDLQRWAPQFTLFPKLPPEIRAQIYAYALPEPRLIELVCEVPSRLKLSLKSMKQKQKHPHLLDYVSKVPIPSLLHVCHESRGEAMRTYELALGYGHSNVGKIFIDFSRDTLLITRQTRELFANIWFSGFPDMDKVKFIACETEEDTDGEILNLNAFAQPTKIPLEFLSRLPNLEECALLVSDLPTNSEFRNPSRSTKNRDSNVNTNLPYASGWVDKWDNFDKPLETVEYLEYLFREDDHDDTIEYLYPIGPRPLLEYQMGPDTYDIWVNINEDPATREDRCKAIMAKVKTFTARKVNYSFSWAGMVEEEREKFRLMAVVDLTLKEWEEEEREKERLAKAADYRPWLRYLPDEVESMRRWEWI